MACLNFGDSPSEWSELPDGGDTGSIMTRIAITATGANQSPFFLGKEAGLFKKAWA